MIDLNTTLGNLHILCAQRGVVNIGATMQGGTCRVVLLTVTDTYGGHGPTLPDALSVAFESLHKTEGERLLAEHAKK